jgi:hypothetical protein
MAIQPPAPRGLHDISGLKQGTGRFTAAALHHARMAALVFGQKAHDGVVFAKAPNGEHDAVIFPADCHACSLDVPAGKR